MSFEGTTPGSLSGRFGVSGFTENYLLQISSPSGATLQDVSESVLLPEDVKGLRILDVGAGASDATAELLKLGADAYALDPLFRSKSELKGKVKKHNKKLSIADVDTGIERAAALERFSDSINKNPERYIRASATSIPFEDNYFDIVYSRAAIFPCLDFDIDILSAAIKECIRVTKPGGTIRLFPYMYQEPDWPDDVNEWRLLIERKITKRLQKEAAVSDVRDVIINIKGLDWRTLIIQKVE